MIRRCLVTLRSSIKPPSQPIRYLCAGTFAEGQSTSASLEAEYQPEIDFILKKYATNNATKQRLTGMVVSDKCSKSISVQIKHFRYIAKYNKDLPVRKKIMAHDENEEASLGDIVTIVPCRPMSRKKRHKLLAIVKKYKSIDDVSA
jgi:small subunit ribosomal protein S17